MVSPPSRRLPASSPTPSLRKSSWRPTTKRPRSCRRSRRRAEVDPRGVVLVIDNYDSFTYNLVQYLGELGERVVVHRNNEITLGEVADLQPVAAVLSPGPGTPGDAGICKDLLLQLGPTLPTLGVCLGHQCLGEAYGGRVRKAQQVMHGKVSPVFHQEQSVFRGIPSPFAATRYHSLVVERDGLPSDLEVTAWTDDGVVMGLRHRQYPLAGVQFHPEAILTEYGHTLLSNFLQDARAWRNRTTDK